MEPGRGASGAVLQPAEVRRPLRGVWQAHERGGEG